MPGTTNTPDGTPAAIRSSSNGTGYRSPNVQFSLQALCAGLFLGILVSFSNTYYGLQAGIYFQMPMLPGLLGYLMFKASERFSAMPLSPGENVLIISAATATGCMPVAAHFGGIIPALEFIIGPEDEGPYHFSICQLLTWAFGLAFFGIFFAALLHHRMIAKDQSPWPGARATAQMLKVMHADSKELPENSGETSSQAHSNAPTSFDSGTVNTPWQSILSILLRLGFGSFVLTISTYFLPILRNIPIFGTTASAKWLWNFDLSLGFIGSGVITGPTIPFHMLSGAIVGWAILSPIAMRQGWAHGPVDDWESGSRSWIIWISTATLMADASVNLAWFIIEPLQKAFFAAIIELPHDEQTPLLSGSDETDISYRANGTETRLITAAPGFNQRTRTLLGVIFIVSICLCVIGVQAVFGHIITWYYVLVAILLALPMAVVGIRAIAECDWNPQNGLVSQLVFAGLVSKSNPNALVINLVTAGIASACASQSGDIAHDFKLGSFVGASPDAQIYGHIAGSIFGTFVATFAYRLYTSQYAIPGPVFQIPGSYISVNVAKLILGKGLPKRVSGFAIGFGIWFAMSAFVKLRFPSRWWHVLLPSGTTFAIGMANLPSFTLSRLVGGIACWVLTSRARQGQDSVIAVGTGLVLGETMGSLVNICLTAIGAPTLSRA